MPLRRGWGLTVEPGKPDVEEDTFTCNHCNGIVFLKPVQNPSDVGGFCRACMQHICDKCAFESQTATKCEPFERRLEHIESRDRLLRAATG